MVESRGMNEFVVWPAKGYRQVQDRRSRKRVIIKVRHPNMESMEMETQDDTTAEQILTTFWKVRNDYENKK